MNHPIAYATLQLLTDWRAKDATSDPEELRAAETELADFKYSMNEGRAMSGERVVYPDEA